MAADATAWNDGGGRARAALNPVRGADRIARFYAGVYGPRHRVAMDPVELNGRNRRC